LTYEEFCRRALRAFGPGLEGTTQASVFEFCARIREEAFPSPRVGRSFLIPDEPPPERWDDLEREWFESVLSLPPDQAAIGLWLHAFETWYALRQEGDSRLEEWLGDEEDPSPPDL
jgi:hypothetical protein